MTQHPRLPDAAVVERIAQEEADKVGVPVIQVLAMHRRKLAVIARANAYRRILRETGCSLRGLAAAWGCDRVGIRYALKHWPEPELARAA